MPNGTVGSILMTICGYKQPHQNLVVQAMKKSNLSDSCYSQCIPSIVSLPGWIIVEQATNISQNELQSVMFSSTVNYSLSGGSN